MPPLIPVDVWVEEYNKDIKYSAGHWTRQYGTAYHGSSVMRTTELGASLSFEFEGSGIQLLGTQGWDHSSFLVTLDGENSIVDGSCCLPNGTVPQVMQFEAMGLDETKHVLKVTNVGVMPQGTVLDLDALVVTQHPTIPIPSVTVPPKNDTYGFLFFLVMIIFSYWQLSRIDVSGPPISPTHIPTCSCSFQLSAPESPSPPVAAPPAPQVIVSDSNATSVAAPGIAPAATARGGEASPTPVIPPAAVTPAPAAGARDPLGVLPALGAAAPPAANPALFADTQARDEHSTRTQHGADCCDDSDEDEGTRLLSDWDEDGFSHFPARGHPA